MTTRQAALTVTRAFVDAVEEDVVRLVLGNRTVQLPAALLPDGVTAGDWIELRIKQLPQPRGGTKTAARRAAMSQDDDGGDLKL